MENKNLKWFLKERISNKVEREMQKQGDRNWCEEGRKEHKTLRSAKAKRIREYLCFETLLRVFVCFFFF